MIRRSLTLSLLLVAFSSQARAERTPAPMPADARLRTVPFEKDNVVTIWGTRGVSTIIILGDDEKIATVALGDTIGWQAVPDQSKQYLFIKPLEPGAVTNMTVVTTRKRIYSFILRTSSGHDHHSVFKVRFTYPDEEADARLLEKARALAAFPNRGTPSARRSETSITATRAHPPSSRSMSSTTGPRPTSASPARFRAYSSSIPTDPKTLVNYRREGAIIVVDRTAGQWTMRSGTTTACVFNMRAAAEPPPLMREGDVQPENSRRCTHWTATS